MAWHYYAKCVKENMPYNAPAYHMQNMLGSVLICCVTLVGDGRQSCYTCTFNNALNIWHNAFRGSCNVLCWQTTTCRATWKTCCLDGINLMGSGIEGEVEMFELEIGVNCQIGMEALKRETKGFLMEMS